MPNRTLNNKNHTRPNPTPPCRARPHPTSPEITKIKSKSRPCPARPYQTSANPGTPHQKHRSLQFNYFERDNNKSTITRSKISETAKTSSISAYFMAKFLRNVFRQIDNQLNFSLPPFMKSWTNTIYTLPLNNASALVQVSPIFYRLIVNQYFIQLLLYGQTCCKKVHSRFARTSRVGHELGGFDHCLTEILAWNTEVIALITPDTIFRKVLLAHVTAFFRCAFFVIFFHVPTPEQNWTNTFQMKFSNVRTLHFNQILRSISRSFTADTVDSTYSF